MYSCDDGDGTFIRGCARRDARRYARCRLRTTRSSAKFITDCFDAVDVVAEERRHVTLCITRLVHKKRGGVAAAFKGRLGGLWPGGGGDPGRNSWPISGLQARLEEPMTEIRDLFLEPQCHIGELLGAPQCLDRIAAIGLAHLHRPKTGIDTGITDCFISISHLLPSFPSPLPGLRYATIKSSISMTLCASIDQVTARMLHCNR